MHEELVIGRHLKHRFHVVFVDDVFDGDYKMKLFEEVVELHINHAPRRSPIVKFLYMHR